MIEEKEYTIHMSIACCIKGKKLPKSSPAPIITVTGTKRNLIKKSVRNLVCTLLCLTSKEENISFEKAIEGMDKEIIKAFSGPPKDWDVFINDFNQQ